MSGHKDFSRRKFFQLLKNLKKNEVSDFLLYLEAPHLKLKNQEAEFMKKMTKKHPDYTNIPFSILDKFFDNNEAKINKAIFGLRSILEKWLTYREVDKNPLLGNQLLTKAYSEYAKKKLFFQFVADVQKTLKEENSGHPSHSFIQFIIGSELFHYPNTDRYLNRNQLVDLSKYLDDYFVAQKLRLICQQASRKQLLKEKSTIPFYQEVLEYAEQQPDNLYFQLYLKLVQLFQKHDDSLLLYLKTQFEQHSNIFDPFEQTIFLFLLQNYVVQLTNNNQLAYLQLQFDLYKLAVEKNLLLYEGKITDETFINVINAACHIKEFSYATQFLSSYSKFLDNGKSSPIFHFSKGYIAYYKGDYEICHRTIKNLKFKKLNFKLTHRALLIRCFYELFQKDNSYYLLFVNKTKNFRRFIRNHKNIAITKKEPYLNFCKALFWLIKIKNKIGSTIEKQSHTSKLINFLEAKDNKAISKKWLLEKTKEI